MATSYWIPLTNSRGLSRVIFFTGLDRPMVIYPALIDTPLLSAQPFYFLSLQECVGKVRFEDGELARFPTDAERERYIQSLADSYLFHFSRAHPELAVTARAVTPQFMSDMTDDIHFGFDRHHTECLALDAYNDDNLIAFSVDDIHQKGFGDHVLFFDFISSERDAYVEAIRKGLRKVATIEAKNHPVFGTGTLTLPIVRLQEAPLTLEELELIDIVRPDERRTRRLPKIEIRRSSLKSDAIVMPKEEIATTQMYHEHLLAYYFCGLRDLSPIARFKNFYNVLEFIFDPAAGEREADQLLAVFRSLYDTKQLNALLSRVGTGNYRGSSLTTSRGESIAAINRKAPDLVADFSKRLYSIRNACLHAKTMRKGKVPPRIVPSLAEEDLLTEELPVLQEVAGDAIARFGRVARR